MTAPAGPARLRRLTELVDAVDREGAALLLRGQPGAGKSMLLDAAGDAALAAGHRVLRTAGVPSETGMPMSGVHRLLRPIMGRLAARLPGRRPAPTFGVDAIAGEELFGVAATTLELLAREAADGPLVLLVDDVQWLDRESREVISFVARRVASDPIVVLGALRCGYDDELGDLGIPIHALGGLAAGDAADLLESRAPGLSPGTQARLLGEAAGNPLAIVELPDPATLAAVAKGVAGPLPITPRLERAFAARARELPAATATVLLVLAAHESGATAEVLAAAALLTDRPLTPAALQPAIDARVLDLDDAGLRFHHPLTRSAIYQAAGLQDRYAAHMALINVLAAQPDRQAWHRAASTLGHDEAVAQAMQERARRALGRGAVLDAATALGRSAELSPDPDRRVERLLDAAELASEVGRAELVCAFVDEAQGLARAPGHRARSTILTEAFQSEASGNGERIAALVDHAEQAGRDGDPDLALKLLLGASSRSWWADPGEAVRERVLAAAEGVRIGQDDPRLLTTVALVAPVTHGAAVSERLPAALRAGRDDPRIAHLLGRAAHAIADFEVSLRLFGTADQGLRAGGRLGLLTHVVVTRAWTSMLVGDWDVAATTAAEGLRLARETSQPLWGGWALVTLSALAGARGDDERAEQLAAEAEQILARARACGGLALLQTARGLTDLSAGRYEEAFANLARCFHRPDPAHHHREQFGAVGFFADAAALTGRQAEAREIVARLGAIAATSGASGLMSGIDHARPLLAADEHAEREFADALRDDAPRSPFDRARQNLFYGMWLRRQRRVIESREPLRVARDAFDVIDAPTWSARASQELRAAGVTHGRGPDKAWDDLSSQELQIAQMAAAGLSNRDIGQRLYLSHRTVASHLNRIFPKLGITSRSQLNGVLPGRSKATGRPR